jgi:hypothetical protein
MPEKTTRTRFPNRSTPTGDRLARTILDSLSAHVAILDENGFIIETNRACAAS